MSCTPKHRTLTGSRNFGVERRPGTDLDGKGYKVASPGSDVLEEVDREGLQSDRFESDGGVWELAVREGGSRVVLESVALALGMALPGCAEEWRTLRAHD
eukprot:3343670-Rhodomonas_salina.9